MRHALLRSGPVRTVRALLGLALLASAALFPLRAAVASEASLASLIPRIKESIVGVGTQQDLRRPPSRLLGTGFVVGDGTAIVTNFHVVSMRLEHNERLVVFTGAGERVRLLDASIIATDADHDTAILRLATGQLRPLVFGEETRALEGTPIAFTGFPIGAVLGLYPVTHRGIISARTPVAIPQVSPRGLDPKMIRRLRTPVEVFQLDATAYPGNSGSPLYDVRTGEVYGIVSSVYVKETKEKVLSEPSGITYAMPIRYARSLLEKLGTVGGGSKPSQ